MIYDLVVYKNEITSEYLDIKGFKNDSTLQGIIDFTSTFKNHYELMKTLCEEGFLPLSYINGNFKIHSRRSKDSEPRLLPYGISYANESKFFSLSFITDYFVRNMDSEEFIDSFIQKYCKYLKNNNSINSELSYLSFCRQYYKQYNKFYDEQHSDSIPRQTVMRKFIEKHTHRKNKNEIVLNETAIRELAMFAINHERNKNNHNPDEITITIDDLKSDANELKNELKHYRTLLKSLNPNDEEYAFYESKVQELEQELQEKIARS